MSSHIILFERKVHLPKKKTRSKKTKKYSEVICTLNNVSSWIKFAKTQIKNDYKNMLKEYILPEPEKEYDSILIHYRILRHTKQKLDKDNVVFALKWIADAMEELGYIKDDKVVNFCSFDTVVDTSLPETMLEIRILSGKKDW